MKLMLILLLSFCALVVVGMVMMAHHSKSVKPHLGLQQGELLPCVSSSNCVNSMTSSDVVPIEFDEPSDQAWQRIGAIISDLGDTVQAQQVNYLWVTFQTPLFGFVDDVEILLLAEDNTMHIRSASRVGRSDFGANKKRIEMIREAFLLKE